MNKQDLAAAIAATTGTSKAQAAAFITALTDVIPAAIATGDEVQITGFGTWKRRVVKGGLGRNPSTGQPVAYGDTPTVSFSAGETFKSVVKAGPTLAKTAA